MTAWTRPGHVVEADSSSPRLECATSDEISYTFTPVARRSCPYVLPVKEGLMSTTADTASAATPAANPSRRALMKGAAWATPVAAFAVGAPALAMSPPCTGASPLNSQARARFLGGNLLNLNLDTIVAVNGQHAQAFLPAVVGSTGGSEYDLKANPLNIDLLSAINLELAGVGAVVTDVLDFVAGQDAGVLNEYAWAHEEPASENNPDAPEVGGSGAVGDDGVINVSKDSANPPALGNINLYSILQNLGGTAVANLVDLIAGLNLDIGAVAGLAELDYVCEDGSSNATETVSRDYLLAYLKLIVESNLVGDLFTALHDNLPSLTISTDAVWDLLDGIPLLGGLLAALGRNALDVTATVKIDQLTGQAIPNTGNPALQLDLQGGTVTIDLAALLGGAYTGGVSPYLNSLAPNTRLFVDAALPTNAVASLIEQLVNDLIERLKDLVEVRIEAGRTSGILPTGLLIQGSLRDFLEGNATALFVLAGIPVNLGALLNPLLGGIGDLVETTLRTLLSDTGIIQTALTGINGLLAALFTVLQEVLRITVNAQNNSTGTMPQNFGKGLLARQYDVAALHIEALGLLDLLDLTIARGSVGEDNFRA